MKQPRLASAIFCYNVVPVAGRALRGKLASQGTEGTGTARRGGGAPRPSAACGVRTERASPATLVRP